MALNPAQLATLKAAILADPVLNAFPNTQDGAWEIANALNVAATPAFTVWQSQMTPELSRAAIVLAATQLDNLTVGKRDALLYLVAGTLDCRQAGVRQAIDDLTGSQNTLKAALVVAEKRLALRIEKILATGAGSDASPATTTFEGAVPYMDVYAARNS